MLCAVVFFNHVVPLENPFSLGKKGMFLEMFPVFVLPTRVQLMLMLADFT